VQRNFYFSNPREEIKVSKEIVIDSTPAEVRIALLEDKRLVELHKEVSNRSYSVGDIHLGKVKRINPGLNAAFVDVGHGKDAFLHYLDLGPQLRSVIKYGKYAIAAKDKPLTIENFELEPDIDKSGKISHVLSPNQLILVQIAKEPISSKGPKITSEISLAGRFIVLVPFSNRISVSQKIKSLEERNRLKRLLMSIKPNNYGVIIRTVAENKRVAELVADLNDLTAKWEKITQRLNQAKAPAVIHREMDRSSSMIRDMVNESFNSIHVNNEDLYDDLKSYIKTIVPEKSDIVKLYKGKKNIFENFAIDLQIKSAFGKKVTMKEGSYLIVEHTEAMHVIDVNSGQRMNKGGEMDEHALATNLEAAREIGRQLRLRDMGGIIVVDFIDMHNRNHRKELFDFLRDAMKADKAKHTILPPTKFGLVQITRQRVRPEVEMPTLEKCPACGGSGEVRASIVLLDEIENNIRYLFTEQNAQYLKLAVHPFVYAYLRKGLYAIQRKWYRTYRKWIRIESVSSYHYMEYHFFNKMDDEISLI
jgi:ribonuclease G